VNRCGKLAGGKPMKRGFEVVGVAFVVLGGCGAGPAEDEPSARVQQELCDEDEPVGLSLFFSNGTSRSLATRDGRARYLREIDVVESVATPDDRGIEPLQSHERLSKLDWRGIEQVEEVWSPGLDGTFTRERYYRGARWMELPSVFQVKAKDARGKPVGRPWVVQAGRDDHMTAGDDMFVRRFVARQSAFGCVSIGNCDGAVFVAEALVQVRGALHPEREAHALPSNTREL